MDEHPTRRIHAYLAILSCDTALNPQAGRSPARYHNNA